LTLQVHAFLSSSTAELFLHGLFSTRSHAKCSFLCAASLAELVSDLVSVVCFGSPGLNCRPPLYPIWPQFSVQHTASLSLSFLSACPGLHEIELAIFLLLVCCSTCSASQTILCCAVSFSAVQACAGDSFALAFAFQPKAALTSASSGFLFVAANCSCRLCVDCCRNLSRCDS
jgi:hypothetical protein